MSKFTYIDLFAGAGGLSLGLSNAGFNLLFANDFNSSCIKTFKSNLNIAHSKTNSNCIIEGDITELYKALNTTRIYNKKIGIRTVTTNKELYAKQRSSILTSEDFRIVKSIKNLDLLCGGPPCQGFSLIVKSKKGTKEERSNGFINDTRNYLFNYFLKFAKSYKPKIILIENVKGLESSLDFKDLIATSIEKLGYKVASNIIKSHEFGIPQIRNRLFFIGVRKDLKISPTKIFTDEFMLSKKFVNLQEAIYDLPQIKVNPKPNNYKKSNELPFANKNSFGMNVSSTPYKKLLKNQNYYVKKINTYKNKYIESDFLYNHKSRYHNLRDKHIFMNLKEGLYLNHPDNFIALNGNNKKMEDGSYFNGIDYIKDKDSNGNKIASNFADKYFKLNANSKSKTIIAHLETDGNSYVHTPINKNKNNLNYARSITPREAARIQSFPDWYKFEGTLRNQYAQIGNAVPPLLAYYIGKTIIKHLSNE